MNGSGFDWSLGGLLQRERRTSLNTMEKQVILVGELAASQVAVVVVAAAVGDGTSVGRSLSSFLVECRLLPEKPYGFEEVHGEEQGESSSGVQMRKSEGQWLNLINLCQAGVQQLVTNPLSNLF